LVSDTDGGGESDYSELVAGRDPLNREDDTIGKPEPAALALNAMVAVQPGIPFVDGLTLEVHAAASREGPFNLEQTFTGDWGSEVALAAANGVERCYTARLVEGARTSGWSVPVCATPAIDPIPPAIEVIRVDSARGCVRQQQALLLIDATDGPYHAGLVPFELDTTQASGISEMLVTSDFSPLGEWEPFRPELTIDLGDRLEATVTIRVRDAFGNESESSLGLTRCRSSVVDEAILLEEQALRRLDAGDLEEARALVRHSLTGIETSIATVRTRLAAGRGSDKDTDASLLAMLLQVRAQKHLALKNSGGKQVELALRAIQRALDLEYALAELASETTRGL
jgi:hypothetical protein